MDLILQKEILSAMAKKNPRLSSAIKRLTDLKDISIGTCVFMGLPVEDYESFDIRFSICNGYLLCLYESELCTQAEYNVLMNTLREIYELKTGDKGLFYNGDDETIKDAQFPETLLNRH